MNIGNETVHGTEIDWEKRNWRKIYTPEEERERAEKMLRLNGAPDTPKLLAASTPTKKPRFRVKRSGLGSSKLKGGSIIRGHGASSHQSFQQHIASWEICRMIYTPN
jgi:hypothetical protein